MASREMKTMLAQNFGVTSKEHYGMLCYFWSNQLRTNEIRVQKHDNDNSAATSGQAYPQRFHNEFEKKKKNMNSVEIATISTKLISAFLYAE